MKLNHWLNLLTNGLVFAIIVMLLIPSELSDQQLKRIHTYMTIPQVYRILGEPTREWTYGAGYGPPGQVVRLVLISKGKWMQPSLSVTIDKDAESPTSMQNIKWTGANHLLWVEYDKGAVSKTWMFPITRSGGGFQGCIDTIKQNWNDWWK